jgi:hypothetical protein
VAAGPVEQGRLAGKAAIELPHVRLRTPLTVSDWWLLGIGLDTRPSQASWRDSRTRDERVCAFLKSPTVDYSHRETRGLCMKRQRREHYRVEYPRAYRPTLVLGGSGYGVVEISERGVRFEAEDTGAFEVGRAVEIAIKFADGDVLDLRGEINRLEASTVVIRLSTAVPLKKIRSEELYLIKNYPSLGSF